MYHWLQSSSFVKLSLYNARSISMDPKHSILKRLRCIMQASVLQFKVQDFENFQLLSMYSIRTGWKSKCLKILNTFCPLFSNKMFLFRAGIYKMLVRIANREDPDQTASDLGLHCLSMLFWQATSVQSFRTFTVPMCFIISVVSLQDHTYELSLQTPTVDTKLTYTIENSGLLMENVSFYPTLF